jgi:choline dehydrogenase-like flavoprotein
MAAKHGTRRRYNEGCRCDDCAEANHLYARDSRQRHADGDPIGLSGVVPLSPPVTHQSFGPGLVERAILTEIQGPDAVARGLAQAALAIARVIDNPRRSASTRPRRGNWPCCWTGCTRPRRAVAAAAWRR